MAHVRFTSDTGCGYAGQGVGAFAVTLTINSANVTQLQQNQGGKRISANFPSPAAGDIRQMRVLGGV
jgi:hypothetical protein